jgi:hypothetical protein
MKSILGHKLVLDSLHSHGPNLEGGKYLPSYNIYYCNCDRGYIEMAKIPRIPKLWEFCEFITLSYELQLNKLKLKKCSLQWDLSNTISYASIKGHFHLFPCF